MLRHGGQHVAVGEGVRGNASGQGDVVQVVGREGADERRHGGLIGSTGVRAKGERHGIQL